ncbi:MAG: RNA polymerase sigma factor region1.1 domain-containing protein, partial [Acidiferrobacterales bacterium]
MDAETKPSDLRALIHKAREQGFLTYREIDDHLPDGGRDIDRFEAVVNVLNGIGIAVFDEPPDPDTFLLRAEPSDDDVPEEAEDVLRTALESEVDRTRDPVGLYLRDMAYRALLTRDDEVALAKRIEEGRHARAEALAACPAVIAEVLHLGDCIAAGEMHLTELVTGFVDPNALGERVPAAMPPALPGDADAPPLEVEHQGPDPEEAKAHFARLRKRYHRLTRALEKHGVGSAQARRLRRELAREFLELKLVPKQIDRLAGRVRDLAREAASLERVVADLCPMCLSHEVFLETARGSETSPDGMAARLMASGAGATDRLRAQASEIRGAQERLCQIESRAGLAIAELKEVHRRLSVAEAKARRAKNELIEANLRLVVSIAKRYWHRG